MIKNIIKIHAVLAVLMVVFASCEKTAVVDITTPYTGAQFKFYNFAVGAPPSHFYAQGIKSSATLSATGMESPTGVLFGGLSPARGYFLTPSGTNVVFKAVTPSTQVAVPETGTGPNIEFATVTRDVVEGKTYSFFTSGVYNVATKSSDAFVIEDNLPAPDTSQAYIRLVNPGHTTSTLSFELTRTTPNIDPTQPPVVVVTTPITGIAYQRASEFIPVKQGAYSLRVIDAVSGKVVIRAATSLLKDRVYTFTLRGNLISGIPAPFIDFTENR